MNDVDTRLADAREDERTRDRRERRAIADERKLAGRRLDALLPYSLAPVDAFLDETGFAPGCLL